MRQCNLKDESVAHVSDMRIITVSVVDASKTAQVPTCPSMTVKVLKQRVVFYTGTPVDAQWLTFNRYLMQTSLTLSD